MHKNNKDLKRMKIMLTTPAYGQPFKELQNRAKKGVFELRRSPGRILAGTGRVWDDQNFQNALPINATSYSSWMNRILSPTLAL